MKFISFAAALFIADTQAIKFTDFMGTENDSNASMLAEVKNM